MSPKHSKIATDSGWEQGWKSVDLKTVPCCTQYQLTLILGQGALHWVPTLQRTLLWPCSSQTPSHHVGLPSFRTSSWHPQADPQILCQVTLGLLPGPVWSSSPGPKPRGAVCRVVRGIWSWDVPSGCPQIHTQDPSQWVGGREGGGPWLRSSRATAFWHRTGWNLSVLNLTLAFQLYLSIGG